MRKGVFALAVLLLLGGMLLVVNRRAARPVGERQDDAAVTAASSAGRADERSTADLDERRTMGSDVPTDGGEESPAVTAAEQSVDEFDALVDFWLNADEDKSVPREVTMAEVESFAESFRKLPHERRDECIHRALNLIPDEKVMLLVGVLLDKSMDRETIKTVFADILNRGEEVKKPILMQIYQDKSHPCWEDAAWILDVTGERPDL